MTLTKRIIPCLDIKDGRTVKGINFENIRDAGNPIELAKYYVQNGADELVFLDITATIEKRKTLLDLVEKIAKEINIPFIVGGGISSLEDAKAVIKAGADKISINSAAVSNPKLISEIANELGKQCIVVAIDTKLENKEWIVLIDGGKTSTPLKAIDWAKQVEKLGAGEILLTSMSNDGMKNGFALDILDAVSHAVNIPIIASGGAGTEDHFIELFTKTKINAALAASVFHFGEILIPQLKNNLKTKNIPVR